MAGTRRFWSTGNDSGVETDRSSATGPPRWVKMAGIVAIALVLLLGYMLLFGGGQHGPSQHAPSGDGGGETAPSSVIDGEAGGGHTPPAGGHG